MSFTLILLQILFVQAFAQSSIQSSAKKLPANNYKQESSLYDQALKENSLPSKISIINTSSGLIEVKDDFDKKPARSWNWLAGFGLESYQPTGSTENLVGSQQSLSQSGTTNMPKIELGAHWNFEGALERFVANFTIVGGFTRQKISLTAAQGENLSADVTSTTYYARPSIGYLFGRWNPFAFMDTGSTLVAVTSDSKLPRQTLFQNFWSAGLSLDYSLMKNWNIKLAARQKFAEQQQSSVELGTYYLW